MSDDNREDAAEAGDGFELSGAIDEAVDGAATGDGEGESSSIFDLFEPPPEIDPNHFGPIPIISDDDGDDIEIIDDGPVSLDTGFSDDDFVDEDADPDPADLDSPTAEFAVADEFAAETHNVETGADETGADETGADETGADEIGAGEIAADGTDDAVSNGLFDEPRGDAPEAASHDDGSVTVDELLAPLEGDAAATTDGESLDVSVPEIDVSGDAPEVFPSVPDAPSGGLPHWTEPATGAVPAVLGGGERDEWSDVTGPQWQGDGPGEGDDLNEVFADTEGVTGIRIDDADHEDLGLAAAGDQQRAGVAPRPRPGPAAGDAEDGGGRNIPQAIAVGVILGGLALLAFQLGAAATITLICAICVLAAVELFNSMRLAGLHPATLLGIVASAALPLAIYHRGEPGYVLVSALTVVFGALWYLVGADSHRPALNLGMTFLGVQWVGGMASFAALLILAGDPGIDIILAAVIVTVVFDTAAYAGGRVFGSHPFHAASPNKTWEGTVIGVAGAVLAGFIVGILEISPFSGDLLHAILLGAVVGILAPIGDLAESMVKRDLGVKDMGTLLPGHGGVLDRLDGLLFVLPGVYYLARVLELI